MTTKSIITAAAFLTLAFAPSLALAGPGSANTDAAIDACTAYNDYGPVELIGVNDDGMGDHMVWLQDVDGYLWGCNVSAEGDIYANVPMGLDLLEGEGAGIIQVSARNPERAVENFCADLAEGDVEVVATAEDGFGDYLVWLDNFDGSFTMCNASINGELYAFETVSMPINEVIEEEAPAVSAPSTGRPSSPGQFG